MKLPHPSRFLALRYAAAAMLAIAVAAEVFAADGALSWKTQAQSFDAEFGQEKVLATYAFTNAGDTPVTIVKASASCGCTVPTLDKTVYQPGESGELTAIFTIGSRQGHQQKTISVLTEEANGAEQYSLTLEVDIPVPVTLKPRVRFWRTGGEAETQDVQVTLDPNFPMQVTGLQRQGEVSSESPFRFEVETLAKDREYVIHLTPKSVGEKARDVFYLKSDNEEANKLLRQYPIYAYVR